jgi:hypothetical protein
VGNLVYLCGMIINNEDFERFKVLMQEHVIKVVGEHYIEQALNNENNGKLYDKLQELLETL